MVCIWLIAVVTWGCCIGRLFWGVWGEFVGAGEESWNVESVCRTGSVTGRGVGNGEGRKEVGNLVSIMTFFLHPFFCSPI